MIKSATYMYNWIAYQANISCHLRKLARCASFTFTFELQCCKQHKYLYIWLFIYIYEYIVVQYLHTTRYSHLLKQLVSYSHANPWLWGPLIIHQGNRNCRLPRHRCTISSWHAPHARTPPTQEKDGTARQALHMQTNYMQHTHTHAHSARERSEARNFLCHHIANELCWLLPRRHAPCRT